MIERREVEGVKMKTHTQTHTHTHTQKKKKWNGRGTVNNVITNNEYVAAVKIFLFGGDKKKRTTNHARLRKSGRERKRERERERKREEETNVCGVVSLVRGGRFARRS